MSEPAPRSDQQVGRVADALPKDGPPPATAPAASDTASTEPTEFEDPAAGGGAAESDDGADSAEQGVESLEEAAEIVEADLADLAGERDEYLDQLRRVQAEFENYRKRVLKQQTENLERAGEDLVAELLPVLDACDAAFQHGDGGIEPVAKALMDVLEKRGLQRHTPEGEPFDPNLHEAVAHEPGEGESVVSEVLRAGYTWKGRVLRPAMVRVRG